MEIRKLEASDAERLEAFLREVPEDDRTFFKEDLADPETIRALTTEHRGVRLIAVDESGRIAGYLRVLPGTGLESHVGENFHAVVIGVRCLRCIERTCQAFKTAPINQRGRDFVQTVCGTPSRLACSSS